MLKDILAILVCPVSGGALRYDSDTKKLICDLSGLSYPVIEGIPVLLAEYAQAIA